MRDQRYTVVTTERLFWKLLRDTCQTDATKLSPAERRAKDGSFDQSCPLSFVESALSLNLTVSFKTRENSHISNMPVWRIT